MDHGSPGSPLKSMVHGPWSMEVHLEVEVHLVFRTLASIIRFQRSGSAASVGALTSYLLTSFGNQRMFAAASGASESVCNGGTCMPKIDPEYPGTAVERMMAVRERTRSLTAEQLNGDWESVTRPALLWAGGLANNQSARPGRGYTGHSFNDWNHCDLTAMLGDVSHNENGGLVKGIAASNQLGPGIQAASLPELGPGGSWSTCMMGCKSEPPRDVAHLQFRSRIAFKLVWCPEVAFESFVLVDDAGGLLAGPATPTGRLPHIRQREGNFKAVEGSKYSVEASNVTAQAVKGE